MSKKNLHVKPTPEELETKIKKDQEELDVLEAENGADADESEDEADETTDDVKVREIKDEADGETKKEAGDADESEDEADGETKKEAGDDGGEDKSDHSDEPDYKKKFVSSQREAKVLHSKLKGFEKASEVPDPTDQDMVKEYPDWEDMSDFEKKIAKNDWKNERRNQAIDQVIVESKNVDNWNKKVDDFIADPANLVKNPRLEGKLEDFQIFAEKPSRRNVDFEDLVSAFLFNLDENKPAKKKGKMFETGTGGSSKKAKSTSDKISVEQASALKQTDYAKYKRYLMAGKISTEI